MKYKSMSALAIIVASFFLIISIADNEAALVSFIIATILEIIILTWFIYETKQDKIEKAKEEKEQRKLQKELEEKLKTEQQRREEQLKIEKEEEEKRFKANQEYLAILEAEREERRKEILARQEAERQERERIAKEEYERKLACKCIICDDCSMGETICSRCSERKEIFKKELPMKRFGKYEYAHQYRLELISSILESKHGFQKEADSLKLIAADEILEDKYKDKIVNLDLSLLSDIHNGIDETELKEKYNLSNSHASAAHAEPEFGDKYGNRTLECLDGDFVRSKAEREIDNFFFNNRIWHIYEKAYHVPNSGKKYNPDFYLPDYNLYIEYFGSEEPKYLRKKDEKIRVYSADPNINFEYLTFEDDNQIYERLQDICRKYSIPTK